MGKIPLGVAAQAVLAYRPALQLKIGVAGVQLPPAQGAAQLLCVPNPARRPVSLLFSSFFKKLLTKPPPTAIISSVVNVVAFYAGVAQLVEQLICNQQVGGSNPSTSSTFFRPTEYGGVPKWPKGTDCKSAGFAFDGSNPSSSTTSEQSPLRSSLPPEGWETFIMLPCPSFPHKA